ncbi:uncharacterized protein [Centruroides vittatus]|uniref:uncharacterized protein isoform X1 n=1 Tax=Centruroides vittatus TaxID=120091 RepID=UPI00350FB94C
MEKQNKTSKMNEKTEKSDDDVVILDEDRDGEDIALDSAEALEETEKQEYENDENSMAEEDSDDDDDDDIDDDEDDIQYIDEVGGDDDDVLSDEEGKEAGGGDASDGEGGTEDAAKESEDGDKKNKKLKDKASQKTEDKNKRSGKDDASKQSSSKSRSSSHSRSEKKRSSERKRKDDGRESRDDSIPRKRRSGIDTESIDRKRKKERDERSLFLNNLPKEITVEGIKKLSPDILDVRIPLEHGKYMVTQYAFIEFKDEATAEKNFKLLSGKEIDDHVLFIDFCGKKSTTKKNDSKPKQVNKKKLFIPDIPAGITVDDFKKYMSEATQLSTIIRGSKRILFATFDTEEAAEKAFQENENLEINGKKLTVLYAATRKQLPRIRNHYDHGYKSRRSYFPRRGFNRSRKMSPNRRFGRGRGFNRGRSPGRGFRDQGMSSGRGFHRGRGFGNRNFQGHGFQQSRGFRGSFH